MIIEVSVQPDTTYEEFKGVASYLYFRSVLQRASGSPTRAAQIAGMNRTAFAAKIRLFNLKGYAAGLREAALDLKHAAHQPGLPAMEKLLNIKT